MTSPRRTAGRLAALLGPAILALAGCGYTVGNAYQADVQTVAVSIFGSESFRREFEEQLTEQVQREIQNRTPFRIAHDETADTRLVARIVQAEQLPLTNTVFGGPRELQMNVAVEVRWEDLRSGELIACQQIPIGPDTIALLSTASFAPETGQSRASAERTAVNSMARQIVDLMETPW
jgi:outer membrane lipopolysaccharide assembly protein LptE/RlpB